MMKKQQRIKSIAVYKKLKKIIPHLLQIKKMITNTEIIDRYLQNEMSDIEKKSFEERLKNDKHLFEEMTIQEKIIEASIIIGIKKTFLRIHKKRMLLKKVIIALLVAILIAFIVLLIINKEDKFFQKNITETTDSTKNNYNLEIPFLEFTVNASIGDTIFYKSGSVIIFPKHSFVDKNGNIVAGLVKVKYREFANPIDLYSAKTHMQFDSANSEYILESSGMLEILAYKENEALFVNQKSMPQLVLATPKTNPSFNLYYFDSLQNKWISSGKPDILENGKTSLLNDKKVNEESVASTLEAPIKPQKPTNNNPIIKILIDPASFKELLVYDNLQFQLDISEKNFTPSDTSDAWSNVELLKTENKGLYKIKFSTAKRTVSYLARPVFIGKDYDKALVIFNKKQVDFENAQKQIFDKEGKAKKKYTSDSITNDKVIMQNKKIERLSILLQARLDAVLKQNVIINEINLANRLYSNFPITQFGYWNCDQPVIRQLIPITGTFLNPNGQQIELKEIAVICKNFNSILRYNSNKIGVVKDVENMIVGKANTTLYYMTYEDYAKLNITKEKNAQTFVMTPVIYSNNLYDNLYSLSK
ncbi:MAG: hypothetical protein KA319_10650 [Ferruginibacter sp.]|nr:hypothetical protein [Ferruginibacter sp.]